jgi:hypothetical protein
MKARITRNQFFDIVTRLSTSAIEARGAELRPEMELGRIFEESFNAVEYVVNKNDIEVIDLQLFEAE